MDTSVRALRNYFLYGNMDCVALLVVNRGRKKGALQQEVDVEVHKSRKVQVENRPLIRGKASEASFPAFPIHSARPPGRGRRISDVGRK